MSNHVEMLTKSVQAEFDATKSGAKSSINTAIIWSEILANESFETLANVIEPVAKSASERMSLCVKHCPKIAELFDKSNGIEDKAQRRLARNAAQKFYAIVYRGAIRGASVAALKQHQISVEPRVRDAIPFVRLVEVDEDNVAHEKDVSITAVVGIAKHYLNGGTGLTADKVKRNSTRAGEGEASLGEADIKTLLKMTSGKLAGRAATDFAGETREELDTLYNTVLSLYAEHVKAKKVA